MPRQTAHRPAHGRSADTARSNVFRLMWQRGRPPGRVEKKAAAGRLLAVGVLLPALSECLAQSWSLANGTALSPIPPGAASAVSPTTSDGASFLSTNSPLSAK